jgi:hypothetical protein
MLVHPVVNFSIPLAFTCPFVEYKTLVKGKTVYGGGGIIPMYLFLSIQVFTPITRKVGSSG